MVSIRTQRLDLIASTLAHLEAELESPQALSVLLGVGIPNGWPPGEYDRGAIEFFRNQLLANPTAVGWYGWYSIDRARSLVIGAAGFLGPPSDDGTVEIGYSIVTEFTADGYATEIVRALVEHAWSVGAVTRIIAHTHSENVGSVKVLERAGFALLGPSGEPGNVEYQCVPPIG